MKTLFTIGFVLILAFSVFSQQNDLVNLQTPYNDAKISVMDSGLITQEGTANGVDFNVSSDGKGNFAEWSIICKKDLINKLKMCAASKENLRVLYSGKIVFVSVGSTHYPGTFSTVKIDDNKPVSNRNEGMFPVDQSLEIIKQLSEGKQIMTRFQEFPNKFNTDKTFELIGFNEAFDYLKWAFDRMK